jgi:hypothetical protein
MDNEDIWRDAEKKETEKIADFYTEYCRSLYDETENPLYVWRAIIFLCDDDRKYPAWIKDYLKNAADNLLRIRDPQKEAPALIKTAIGLYSARDFSEFHDSWKKYEAFDRVMEERKRRKQGEKDVILYGDVGDEFGVSGETIKRWYLEVKKWRDKLLEDDQIENR